MGVNYNPKIVADGLVLALDAANPKSYPGTGTTWYDLSGNGNDGTLLNGVGYDSDNKGSFSFDGSNDCVSISNTSSINPTNQMTASCWCYKSNWQETAWQNFISKTENGSYQIGMNHPFSSLQSSIHALVYFNGNYRFAEFNSLNFNQNSWNKLGFICDGRYLKFFLNGELVDTVDTGSVGTIKTTSNHLVIGAEPGSGTNISGQYFDGKISSVQIYNRALTEPEIKQNFNATRSRYGI